MTVSTFYIEKISWPEICKKYITGPLFSTTNLALYEEN